MRRAILAAIAAASILFSSAPASASPTLPRHVVLFLVNGMSFEKFMAVPEFRALARAGGAALMSPNTPPGDKGPGAYTTLGAGARSASSRSDVLQVLNGSTSTVEIRQLVADNRHRSVPGLLGSILEQHRLTPCAAGVVAGLVAMDRAGRVREYPSPSSVNCSMVAIDLSARSGASAGAAVRRDLSVSNTSVPQLVIVLEAMPSVRMSAVGDEVTPIVMATGSSSQLFHARGLMHSLTSDTTRRDGLVSNEDVAPTVLRFFGIPVPADMNGAPIRVIDQAPPFDLHRRHLEERRLTVPVQVAVNVGVAMLGFLALFLVWRKPRASRTLGSHAGAISLAVAPAGVASLAAGGLPHITYPWVVPFLIVVPVAAAILAVELRRRGTLVPAAAIGTAVLTFFVVEAIQGWPDMLTTLSGGTALDGNRFYGMGNVDIGIVLAATLWVAASLTPYAGFALLVGAGLFCGFPDLGVNFGAAVTLFAAAGMWLPLRSKGRLRWRDVVSIAVIVIAGLAVVIVANLLWSHAPTHGARFVHNAPNRGWSGLLHFVGERFATNWRLLVHAPFLWITTLGLLPELYVVLRPPPMLRDAFSRYPSWRDAVLVTILASMVALVVNDSGAAAASWGSGLAAAGIFYLPLVEETWRTASTATARRP